MVKCLLIVWARCDPRTRSNFAFSYKEELSFSLQLRLPVIVMKLLYKAMLWSARLSYSQFRLVTFRPRHLVLSRSTKYNSLSSCLSGNRRYVPRLGLWIFVFDIVWECLWRRWRELSRLSRLGQIPSGCWVPWTVSSGHLPWCERTLWTIFSVTRGLFGISKSMWYGRRWCIVQRHRPGKWNYLVSCLASLNNVFISPRIYSEAAEPQMVKK